MTVIPTIRLNDGLEIPALGFGTSQLRGEAAVASIGTALQLGYRLLDTAFNYENEGAVGKAIQQSAIARSEIFVTSKLPGRHHRYAQAVATIEESIYRMGLEYCDLYLIHWPNPSQKLYVEAWQALVEAKKRGLIKSVGVSNFLPEHLEAIIAATGVAPSVNQIELHPHFVQQEQREWQKRYDIVTESWSPLGRASNVLQEPAIEAIAQRSKKTVAQVILRWHYQLGLISVPKATSVERQKENIEIFDFTLTDDEMTTISSLSHAQGRIMNQDPRFHEEM